MFLPKTPFPMRVASLPPRATEMLEPWKRLGIYGRLRAAAAALEVASPAGAFTLHDVPGVRAGQRCTRGCEMHPEVGVEASAPDLRGRGLDTVAALASA